jgi:hypothetical protein
MNGRRETLCLYENGPFVRIHAYMHDARYIVIHTAQHSTTQHNTTQRTSAARTTLLRVEGSVQLTHDIHKVLADIFVIKTTEKEPNTRSIQYTRI